jgi:hypothetical protein
VLRAEIDAGFFHLYGVARRDVEHVLESFWVIRENDEAIYSEYRTKEAVLRAYDGIAVASRSEPFRSAVEPPPGDPSAAHGPGHWVPWEQFLETAKSPAHHTAAGNMQLFTGGRDGADSRSSTGPDQEPTLFGSLADGNHDGWIAEAAVDRRSLVVGGKVRHRSHGEGTILGVRESGRSVSLLVRFHGAEREIAFGYGVLELQVKESPP